MISHAHPPASCIYGLREELSFCECNRTYIFLDAAADKYFGMVGSTATVFRSFVSGNALSAAEIETLHAAGITAPASEPVITMEMRLPLPLNQHEAALTGALTLGRTISAVMAIRQARRRIRKRRIADIFAELRTQRDAIDDRRCQPMPHVASILRAFEHTRLWIASADQCLPRTYALVRSLARCNYPAVFVIGVRSDPFQAHCWAQHGTDVLNDSPEEVAKFTPILAI